jgi:PPIC-type PPIASE domain
VVRLVPHALRGAILSLALAGWSLAAASPASVRLGSREVPPLAVGWAIEECMALGAPLAACISEQWLPGWRLAVHAEAADLDKNGPLQRIRRALLVEAFADALASEVPEPPPDAVAQAYQANLAEYVTPERIQVFRLLLPDRPSAEDFLRTLPATVQVSDWRAWTRERSIDTATKERGGDLGFVRPDGTTDIPEVRVDRALYDAVLPLKDGEILRTPVQESSGWAVLWRRSSLPARSVSLAEASAELRSTLREAQAEKGLADHIAKLRSTILRSHNPDKIAIYREHLPQAR